MPPTTGYILPVSYQFEGFQLDVGRYELRRSGHVLRLEKIPMELLILLISRQGGLVSREEIAEKLWGQDVFIETEHGINTAVRKIRQTWVTNRSNRGSYKPWLERDTASLRQLALTPGPLRRQTGRNQRVAMTMEHSLEVKRRPATSYPPWYPVAGVKRSCREPQTP